MFVNIQMIPEDDASPCRGALLHLLRSNLTFLLGLEHLEFPVIPLDLGRVVSPKEHQVAFSKLPF